MNFYCTICNTPTITKLLHTHFKCMCDEDTRSLPISEILSGQHQDKINSPLLIETITAAHPQPIYHIYTP